MNECMGVSMNGLFFCNQFLTSQSAGYSEEMCGDVLQWTMFYSPSIYNTIREFQGKHHRLNGFIDKTAHLFYRCMMS